MTFNVLEGGPGEVTQADLENIVHFENQQRRQHELLEREAGEVLRKMRAGAKVEPGPRMARMETFSRSGVEFSVLLVDGKARYCWACGEITNMRDALREV